MVCFEHYLGNVPSHRANAKWLNLYFFLFLVTISGQISLNEITCDMSRYESHYAQPLARKKGAKLTDAEEVKHLNRMLSPDK